MISVHVSQSALLYLFIRIYPLLLLIPNYIVNNLKIQTELMESTEKELPEKPFVHSNSPKIIPNLFRLNRLDNILGRRMKMTKSEKHLHRGELQKNIEKERQHQIQNDLDNQIINSVGPDLSIRFEPKQSEIKYNNLEQPALYGQSQVVDDLGPIYAIPTYPWQQNNASVQKMQQWQSSSEYKYVMSHGCYCPYCLTEYYFSPPRRY